MEMIRTCRTCDKLFEDLSEEDTPNWLFHSDTGFDPLKDEWIYSCPFCDSSFERTLEEWKTDSANKILDKLGYFKVKSK